MLFLSNPFLLANAQFLAMLGIILIVTELKLQSKGAAAFVGALLFVVGTSSLVYSPNEFWRLSWPTVIILNILVLGSLGIIVLITYRDYNRHRGDLNPIIGQTARVIEWNADHKRVELADAIWQAESSENFKSGDRVKVTGQHNLTVTVTGEKS